METVRVRIAVATNAKGDAIACGLDTDHMSKNRDPERFLSDWGMLDGEVGGNGEALRFSWIEADVPLPSPTDAPTIEGTVTP
jgi:hypothetical protein